MAWSLLAKVGVSGGMKTKKADLGERSTFYFDEKLGRWVDKSAPGGSEEAEEPPPPPPPVGPSMTLRPQPSAADGNGGSRSPPTKSDVRGRYVEVGFGGRGGGGVTTGGLPAMLTASKSSFDKGKAPLLPAAPMWAVGAAAGVAGAPKMFMPKPMTPEHSRTSLAEVEVEGGHGAEEAGGTTAAREVQQQQTHAAAVVSAPTFAYVEPDEAMEAAASMAAAAAARREARAHAAMEPCAAPAPLCMEGCMCVRCTAKLLDAAGGAPLPPPQSSSSMEQQQPQHQPSAARAALEAEVVAAAAEVQAAAEAALAARVATLEAELAEARRRVRDAEAKAEVAAAQAVAAAARAATGGAGQAAEAAAEEEGSTVLTPRSAAQASWEQGVSDGKAMVAAELAEQQEAMDDLLVCLGQEEAKMQRLWAALEEHGVDVHALLADLVQAEDAEIDALLAAKEVHGGLLGGVDGPFAPED